jgi:sugar fermentation stimulation protein A
MRFDPPLVEARLRLRYKRFLADMEIPGEIDGAHVTVHCPNPGSMLGLAEPGSRCWLSPKVGTKLAYGWELVETSAGALVGIHTTRANAIVAEGLAAGRFPGLPSARVQREVKVGTRPARGRSSETESRLDFRLEDAAGNPCWVEVKSVTLSRRSGRAEFPDAKTARGARHLAELAALKQRGERAVLLFLAQRADCGELTIAADIDPFYASALTQVRAQGVEIMAFSCGISPMGIDVGRQIAFIHR